MYNLQFVSSLKQHPELQVSKNCFDPRTHNSVVLLNKTFYLVFHQLQFKFMKSFICYFKTYIYTYKSKPI